MLFDVFMFAFAAIAVGSLAAMFLVRNKRGVFFVSTAAAAIAATGAFYEIFWVLIVFGLLVPWALFCALNVLDLAWRAKAGLVLSVMFACYFAIYPTYHEDRHGKVDYASMAPEERASQQEQALAGDLGWSRFIVENIGFRLVRGLDLKGGLRLVYNVDVAEAIKDKRDRHFDAVREALTKSYGFASGDDPPTPDQLGMLEGKVKLTKSRDEVGVFTVTFNDPADSHGVAGEVFLARYHSEMDTLRGADGKLTFRIRSDVESFIRESAVAQAKQTVLRRIDSLGLKEASVSTRDEDIIIEVPGDDDRQFDQIRDIISQTARLEFKLVDDDTDFFAEISKAPPEGVVAPKGLRFEVENAPIGEGKTKPITVAMLVKAEGQEMKEALEEFRAWIDQLGVPDTHEIGFEKRLEFDEESGQYEEVGWRTYFLYGRAEITGDMIESAQAQPDQSETGFGNWLVSMEFNSYGGDRFAEITEANIKRRFAIILDGVVESAPVIQSRIAGGRGQITLGAGSPEQQRHDAKQLELVLKSGALPAPITPIKEDRIGPTLGADSIERGVEGALIGGGLVLLIMGVYYSRAGLIANVSVLLNLAIQISILAAFGASLTLPGIAGLALTVGMAVDANVLINERIREELRLGKTPRSAVDTGYDRAFSAIIDGNITSLIAALILAQYGTGPIKGFAITLFIGLLTNLFTGVFCTRIIFDFVVRYWKVKKLHLG